MKSHGKITVIEDEGLLRKNICSFLGKEGYEVDGFQSGFEGLNFVLKESPDLVLMDIRLPDSDGVELLKKMLEENQDVSVIMMTAYGTMDTVIECVRTGAENFIKKPFKLEELKHLIRNTLEKKRLKDEIQYLRSNKNNLFGNMTGESLCIENVCKTIEKVSPTSATVLLLGESGTGKQVVAKEIHQRSERRDKPFIEVNCGAIPHNLLESELFGHTKGSFTGAVNSKKGLFLLASTGTLFLDEIAEMPLETQVKVLKAIEDKTIRPVGSEKEYQIDVRIIAATNRNLEDYVQKGEFREDLYYRLNVFPIILPPLRERGNDIILLAEHFIRAYSSEMKKDVTGLQEPARKLLLRYNWPGNVRELKNTIERAILYADHSKITSEDLGLKNINKNQEESLKEEAIKSFESIPEGVTLEDYLSEIEKRAIEEVLQRNRFNQSKTATVLGLTREKLRYRMIKHNLM